MDQALHKISSSIGWLNENIGRAVAWLTFILVIIMCTDVTLRYLFNSTSAWIIELEWHLFALIFILGAGYSLKHDRHVRVDLFYANFSERDKAWINLLGSLIFLIPWCLVMIYVSYNYAFSSYLTNEGSPDPGGLPARYLIKFSVTIGMSLLLLQAIAIVAESWLELRNASQVKNRTE